MALTRAEHDRNIFKALNDTVDGVFRASAADPDIPAIFTVDDQVSESGGDTSVVAGGALITALQADVGLPRRGAEFEGDGKRYTVDSRQFSNDPSLVVCFCTVEDI